MYAVKIHGTTEGAGQRDAYTWSDAVHQAYQQAGRWNVETQVVERPSMQVRARIRRIPNRLEDTGWSWVLEDLRDLEALREPRPEAFPLVLEWLDCDDEPVWRPVARWLAVDAVLVETLGRVSLRPLRLVDESAAVVLWEDGNWLPQAVAHVG
jgi:hypothetical protein